MTTVKDVQNILRLTFGIVPIVAGFDKFTNLLTHWTDYLGVNISGMIPVSAITFMKIVGIIEILAGIIVLVRPLIGAYIVMAWLICIALQLIIGGHFFDVAVRDLGTGRRRTYPCTSYHDGWSASIKQVRTAVSS